jgi:hypothetical protein
MSTLCPCSLPIVSNTTLSLPPRAHPEPLGNNATGIIYTHGSQVLAATSAQKKEYAALAAQVIAARASRFGSAAVVIARRERTHPHTSSVRRRAIPTLAAQ